MPMIPCSTPDNVAYARGYSPSQICFPNARNPEEQFDEVGFYMKSHPIFAAISRLARARILQALLDIVSKNETNRNMAFSWIFSDTSDFRAWCFDAGFAPKVVRHKARQMIDGDLPYYTKAGESPRYEERKLKRKAIK